MKVLGAIKSVIDKIMEVINVIILAIMSVLVVYQVFARFVLNSPSAISEALSQYLFVWMIMFGSAYVFGVREHLTIDLIRDKFPPAVEMVVEKNCKAYLAADAFDAVKYISRLDSVIMHVIYKMKYSKQKNK